MGGGGGGVGETIISLMKILKLGFWLLYNFLGIFKQ